MTLVRTIAFLLFTLIFFQERAHASGSLGWVSLGCEFASGDYGTGVRSSSLFVPVSVGVTPSERWGVSVEIPYVYQTRPNFMAGQIRRMQPVQGTTQKMVAAMGRHATGSGGGGSGVHGLGDITVKTWYTLLDETDLFPRVGAVASVKVPTADKDRGLGTGEFDVEISLELTKWLGDVVLFAEPGYVFQGDSPELFLKDYVKYVAGAGYQFTDTFRTLILFKGAGPVESGSSSPLEARLKMLYQFSDCVGVDAYVAKGITDSTHDYAAGAAVSYTF